MTRERFPRLTALFARLTGLYPEPFRSRFAREMTSVFASQCERRYEDQGLRGVVPLAASSLWGVCVGALVERVGGALDWGRRHRWRRPGRRSGMMSSFFQDVRFGLRNFVKTPSFALLAVSTLALGIAVNTTIFSLINTVLFAELPLSHPDRFVFLWRTNERAGENRARLSLPDVAELRARADSFEGVALALEDSFVFSGRTGSSGRDEPERVTTFRVTDNFFDVWGIGTVLGRGFSPGEDRAGSAPVTVLSHGFWERRFGSDPAVIGSSLRLDGESVTVVGVLSPKMEFGDLSSIDLWVPLHRDLATAPRDERVAFTQALLKPDVSLEQAQAEMETIAARLGQEFSSANRGWGLRVSSVAEELLDEEDNTLMWVLIISVSFVLLIACANVANMLMARATSRSKEVAVRLALGAQRWRLLRQFLTEGFLLSLAAGALGLLLARGMLDLLVLITSEQHWLYRSADLDPRVLLFTLGISALTPFVFGFVPSLRASRPDLTGTLKEGGRSGTGPGGMRSRGLLVGAQVSMALMLMVVTGLLVRAVIELRQVDTGLESEALLLIGIDLPEAEYESEDAVQRFAEELLGRASETPGVVAAAIMNPRPLALSGSRRSFQMEGQTLEEDIESPTAYLYTASADFLAATGIPLLSGRSFDRGDHSGAPPVALVSETAAKRYWSDEAPLGRRIRLSGASTDERWIEVVGVVGDTLQLGRRGNTDPVPQVYLPFSQSPSAELALVVRTEAEPAALTEAMSEHVRALGQPVDDMRTMKELRRELFASSDAIIALFSIFATFALVMASMGIYGVMSYAVSQQEHEIGIRMALGASGLDVLRIVGGQGAKLVLVGSAAGMVGAFFLARMLAGVGFGVKAMDPATFIAVPVVLILVALAANYLPARRATRIDPIETLRTE